MPVQHGVQAAYNSSLAEYLALNENLELAKEAYKIMHYNIAPEFKTYLEVITAETDLRSAVVDSFLGGNIKRKRLEPNDERLQFAFEFF